MRVRSQKHTSCRETLFVTLILKKQKDLETHYLFGHEKLVAYKLSFWTKLTKKKKVYFLILDTL